MTPEASSSWFSWEAVTTRGARREGRSAGESRAAVAQELRQRGMVPLKIVEAAPRGWTSPGRRSVPPEQLAVLTRQLASLIEAGLPLLQSCAMLAKQQRHPALAAALRGVGASIESGATLAGAVAEAPGVFGPLYVAMTAAGEASGQLAGTLQQLAASLERSARVRTQVLRALFYPATILVVGIGAAALLMVFVIPSFAETFAGFGAELPLPTRVVIALSDWATAAAGPATAAFGLSVAGLRRVYATPRGRTRIDGWLLRIPLIGGLLRAAAGARIAGTLATLLPSGVPIVAALRTAAPLAGNRVIERQLEAARAGIEEGRSLAAVFGGADGLPPILADMVDLGEQTGALDTVLARAAEYLESDLERGVARFTAALEPAAVVFLGVVLGGLVIAMYLPVFQLGSML